MPACLPEQFICNEVDTPPLRTTSRAASSSSGKSLVLCKALSSSPALAKISRAACRCSGRPSWLAQTSANKFGGSFKPAATIAVAKNGFVDDRGKIIACGEPTLKAIEPLRSRQTTAPWCHDSCTPLRNVIATGFVSDASMSVIYCVRPFCRRRFFNRDATNRTRNTKTAAITSH